MSASESDTNRNCCRLFAFRWGYTATISGCVFFIEWQCICREWHWQFGQRHIFAGGEFGQRCTWIIKHFNGNGQFVEWLFRNSDPFLLPDYVSLRSDGPTNLHGQPDSHSQCHYHEWYGDIYGKHDSSDWRTKIIWRSKTKGSWWTSWRSRPCAPDPSMCAKISTQLDFSPYYFGGSILHIWDYSMRRWRGR